MNITKFQRLARAAKLRAITIVLYPEEHGEADRKWLDDPKTQALLVDDYDAHSQNVAPSSPLRDVSILTRLIGAPGDPHLDHELASVLVSMVPTREQAQQAAEALLVKHNVTAAACVSCQKMSRSTKQ